MESKKKKKEEKIQSPHIREGLEASYNCCFPAPFLGLTDAPIPRRIATTTITTAKALRHNFTSTTTVSLFPNTHFTNHESLPPLHEAFSNFIQVYPQYITTEQVDHVRDNEYDHLSNHVCLDYTGSSLFSHAQLRQSGSFSSQSPTPNSKQVPTFNISYKSANLNSQVLYGSHETKLESTIRKRIMSFLNVSETDYCMVFTANRTSAFKLLAESYPFHSNKRLLTVYDYQSEAVTTMVESSNKKGAKVMSSSFSWPGLRIQSPKLKKMVMGKRRKKNRGLFVFPLQSRVTGTRYSYLWMSVAQENGWHVLLDACALGPKDMDTLGLSMFHPDFIICSFFKVFGEDPSGFGCLLIKRSKNSVLEASTVARGVGIVSLVPAKKPSQLQDEPSSGEIERQFSEIHLHEDNVDISSSFSGPLSTERSNGLEEKSSGPKDECFVVFEKGETSKMHEEGTSMKKKGSISSEIIELEEPNFPLLKNDKDSEIECQGLDHADSIGLLMISSRVRYLVNYLVNALMKLHHPHPDKGHPLVKIYGPKIKFDRGPAVAFNIFDWKNEMVEPALIQKLADRNNISLSCEFLHNIWFSEKYEDEKQRLLEKRIREVKTTGNKRREKVDIGITVVTASIAYLTNFEDIYRVWLFVAKFLDADFVEKERWRYMALNQKMVEV
ncbi:Molybdenum cofactor sulfurase [Acorus gramineus]|uniref:Molybdenum cofactor sulfurase n=1 Tax=Acorus gramineus TaxID=55184 RepID=A0AAV9AI12_ACOGR|nr:Molybdenum cofactor sulfurase [Acorus gramineus]